MSKKCFGSTNAIRLIAVTLLTLIFVERPLKAYADPGSGLLVWQLLGAVVVGAVCQTRRAVKRIKTLVSSEAPPEEQRETALTKAGAAGRPS